MAITSSKIYRLLLQKAYFEKGNGLLSISRYVIIGGFLDSIGLGIASLILYCLISYTIGRLWFKKKIPIYEAEIGNQFNLLSIQLRKDLKLKEKKKL